MSNPLSYQYWYNHGRDDGLEEIPRHIQLSAKQDSWEKAAYLEGFNSKRMEVNRPQWTLEYILNHRALLDNMGDSQPAILDSVQVQAFTELGMRISEAHEKAQATAEETVGTAFSDLSKKLGLPENEIPPSGEVRTTSATGGQKGVKPERYDLIPVEALDIMAKLYGFGAVKYAAHNWRKGYEWSKSYASLMRHATRFWAGEDYDEETGLPHLAGVGFHAFTLMVFMIEHPNFDDRFTTVRDQVEEEPEETVEDKPVEEDSPEPIWEYLEGLAKQFESECKYTLAGQARDIAEELQHRDAQEAAIQNAVKVPLVINKTEPVPKFDPDGGYEATPKSPVYNSDTGMLTIPNPPGIRYYLDEKEVTGRHLRIRHATEITARPSPGWYVRNDVDMDWVFRP